MPLPTVAIVGRPNVGKSTLFNRLVGKKLALVDDRPGVTRDRREGEARLLGLEFRVIDTAGYEDEDVQTLPGRMRKQTEAAVADADVALFLIDAREGVTPIDSEIARWLRAADTPGVIVANQPTWGLDVGAVAYVHSQLLAARDRGAAVVLISEDLDELLALADRIAVMFHGTLSAPRRDWTVAEIGLAMAGGGEPAPLPH